MLFRSFIALEAPEQVRRELAAQLQSMRPQPGVNWVADANLHLTLLFLGDVEGSRIPALEKILGECTNRWPPFTLSLRGLELFPSREPRLVWATLATPDNALRDAHKDLLRAVREEGFEPDAKPLKLHITLGRIKRALPPDMERDIMSRAVDTSPRQYDRVTLFRSVLRPEGPVYHSLHQYQLQ